MMLSWIDGAPMVLSRADGSPVISSVELSHVLDTSSPALDTLDVFFISCVECLELGGVHNPKKPSFLSISTLTLMGTLRDT